MQHENIAPWHIQVLQFALETLESNIICTIEQSHGGQGCPFVQNKSAGQTSKQRKGMISALQGHSNKHKQRKGMMVSLQKHKTQTLEMPGLQQSLQYGRLQQLLLLGKS